MKKYLRYYFHLFTMNIMDEMANRENFFTWAIIHTFSLLTYILFFEIVFSNITDINGWTKFQVLLVLGIGSLIMGLGSLTFFSFMYGFSRDVANGDFDFKLTKPLDSHFLASFNWVDLEDVIVIPNSIVLIVYSLSNLVPINLILWLPLFLLLLLSSMVILFSILTLIESLAFKFIRVNAARDLFWALASTGRYPTKSMANVSRLAAIILAPMALISSVPAEVLMGRPEINWVLASILTAASLFVLCRLVFVRSLNHYSSASS